MNKVNTTEKYLQETAKIIENVICTYNNTFRSHLNCQYLTVKQFNMNSIFLYGIYEA